MQKLPNNPPPHQHRHTAQFVIIGNPENRRVGTFRETARHLGYPDPIVLSWHDWLTSLKPLTIPTGSIVKIDSPGENNTVRQLLAQSSVPADFGLITPMESWYKGFCTILDTIRTQVKTADQVTLLNHPDHIKTMFDKPGCHNFLRQLNIPVPRTLPRPSNFDDLLDNMNTYRIQKVFIKPAHSSSASGVIAFRKMGNHLQAITSAEITSDGKLYNSLTVRTYTKEEEIRFLIDRSLEGNVIIEEWLPKATLNDRYFDIRVVVINKHARHVVLRTSRNIITNLHLGNRRGNMQDFIQQFGEEKLEEIKALAERTAACFPDSFYMGVDILLTADRKKLVVLEVNAFGDLLPGLLDEGYSVYELEINAIIAKLTNDRLNA